VSSEDSAILKYVEASGFEVYFKRHPSLSQDSSSTLSVVQDAVRRSENIFGENYELVMTLQPTSPLRNNLHIDGAIELINQNEQCNSLVSVMKVPHQYGYESLMEFKSSRYISPVVSPNDLTLDRHSKKSYLARNGAAIYITRRNILNLGLFYPDCIPYFMNKIDSVDIDDLEDLFIAESILTRKRLFNKEK
jgi:CMP-N-acetylneuraminic acid synthetase